MNPQDPAESSAASYSVDMAEAIDSLEDRVKERLVKVNVKELTLDQLAKITASIVEETVRDESDSPMMRQKIGDNLNHCLLALATNRSHESLTSVARRFTNPATGKPYTRAAISARLTALTDRTSLVLRVQRNPKVREIYKERAKNVHARRRRECPKWAKESWLKGLKGKRKCK